MAARPITSATRASPVIDQALPPGIAEKRQRSRALVTRHGALLALVVLILFNATVSPNFLSVQNFYVDMTQVAAIVIVAVGMTLVIATGGIDLSVGSLMAISGALAPLIFMGVLFDLPHSMVGVALAFMIPV